MVSLIKINAKPWPVASLGSIALGNTSLNHIYTEGITIRTTGSHLNAVRELVQSPCGKINVIMTLGGRGSWSMIRGGRTCIMQYIKTKIFKLWDNSLSVTPY